jgi:transcriptional regulator with XRE-family HTH domain
MAEPTPTIRGRELGAELKNLRTKKGMTLEEVRDEVDLSVSKLSRLENGIRGAKLVDVAALLVLYRVGGRRRDELLELCEGADKTGWLQRFGTNLPPVLKSLVNQESEAVKIRNFETMYIPGLLQTDEYTRAVLQASPTVPENEIEERIAARRARQVILSRERPPVFESIITESALRCPVGGPIVMAGQLRWLVERARRPHISVRVLPTSIGAHAGMAGPFVIMDFRGVPSVVHLENKTSSLSLDEKPETDAYKKVYDQLNEDALSEEDSVAFIATLANEIAETI